MCGFCLSRLDVEFQCVPCHKSCPRGSSACHPTLSLSQASWPHWWTYLLYCRIRSGSKWCLKDVLFFRPASVPGSFYKALGEACCCTMGLRGAAPSQTHPCHLQCPSTGCSMSTWCLQAATLRWRCGGRSTRRRRCTPTSWALFRSGCARATASVRSTSRKVTLLPWGLETQLGLCSQLLRGKHSVCHLSRGVVLWRKKPFSPNFVFTNNCLLQGCPVWCGYALARPTLCGCAWGGTASDALYLGNDSPQLQRN